MSSTEPQEPVLPVLTLLQRIKDGMADPRSLDQETRQACVEAMLGEGITQAQIAVHMKCSDKTIQRDAQEVRRKNALLVTPEFVREIIGEMGVKARMHASRLMQLSRSGNGSVMEKAQAEFYAWQVFVGYMAKLQSFGCLPQKPQEIIGDVFHHQAEESGEESWMEMEEIIKDVELTTKGKSDPQSVALRKDLQQIKSDLGKAKLLTQLKNITQKAKELKRDAVPENENENG